MYNLEYLWPYIWPLPSKGYISLESGMLDPGIIIKTHPRSILVFIKAV